MFLLFTIHTNYNSYNTIDQGAACPHFLEAEPLQAEAPAKSQSQNTSASWAMVVPKKEILELPNGDRESSSMNFINLKSSWVTNQIQSSKENTGFRPDPVTTAQNQVTNWTFQPMREHPAKVSFCRSYTLATFPHFPQYFEETLMENT
ncbi:hypothetical protein DSO57_1037637 [Entomophthora muscae]|uniref:Uncharacterized protein n=1 Tax=Entomophthora muscae TaxID=34485 RepID=A0ACC2TA18_9FUNG|nr:hypothetical protein DSO57_1037637 [Entomophthora muscae]